MSWIGLLLFLLTRLPIMSRKIKVYGKTNPLFGWIISHHFAALFTYFSCEEVMYLMSSFMYIYHFSLSQWLIFNQKWAKNISKIWPFFPISVHITFLSMRHICNLKIQKYDSIPNFNLKWSKVVFIISHLGVWSIRMLRRREKSCFEMVDEARTCNFRLVLPFPSSDVTNSKKFCVQY